MRSFNLAEKFVLRNLNLSKKPRNTYKMVRFGVCRRYYQRIFNQIYSRYEFLPNYM